MNEKEAIEELKWVKERGFVADKGIAGTERIEQAVQMGIDALMCVNSSAFKDGYKKGRADAIQDCIDLFTRVKEGKANNDNQ